TGVYSPSRGGDIIDDHRIGARPGVSIAAQYTISAVPQLQVSIQAGLRLDHQADSIIGEDVDGPIINVGGKVDGVRDICPGVSRRGRRLLEDQRSCRLESVAAEHHPPLK